MCTEVVLHRTSRRTASRFPAPTPCLAVYKSARVVQGLGINRCSGPTPTCPTLHSPQTTSIMSAPAVVAPTTGMAPVILEDDKHNVIDHLDHPQKGEQFDAVNTHGFTSKYADLSLKATLRSFPMATTYALLAAFNALNDGYCYSIPGPQLIARCMRS